MDMQSAVAFAKKLQAEKRSAGDATNCDTARPLLAEVLAAWNEGVQWWREHHGSYPAAFTRLAVTMDDVQRQIDTVNCGRTGFETEEVTDGNIAVCIDEKRFKLALNALYRICSPRVDYRPDDQLGMAKQAAEEAHKYACEVLSELRSGAPEWFMRADVRKDMPNPSFERHAVVQEKRP